MLIGLHGDHRPLWSEGAFRRLALAQPDLVKMMTSNDLAMFRRVKELLPSARAITRLFWPGRPPSPPEFVGAMSSLIEDIMALGCGTFELLNEPNAPWEGFGPDGARDFNSWALEAIPLLRQRFKGVRLLWPALAVHPGLNDVGWWRDCWRSIVACDGLAGHGYWSASGGEWAMDDRQWGLRFLVAMEMYPHKELWVTEAGCTDPGVSKADRARLYPRYALKLRELGVMGVAFWLLEGDEEWERRENAFFDDEMAEALRRLPRQAPSPKARPTVRVGNLEGVLDRRHDLSTRGTYPQRELSAIKYLVVHHSGVDSDSSAEAIASYHTRSLGWPGIGYHFLVHWDGAIEYVGDIAEARYNVARRNQEVVGVCLPGDFSRRSPEEAQLEAARVLLVNLQFALGWFVPIVGHGEVALPGFATACPGDTWPQWKPLLQP